MLTACECSGRNYTMYTPRTLDRQKMQQTGRCGLQRAPRDVHTRLRAGGKGPTRTPACARVGARRWTRWQAWYTWPACARPGSSPARMRPPQCGIRKSTRSLGRSPQPVLTVLARAESKRACHGPQGANCSVAWLCEGAQADWKALTLVKTECACPNAVQGAATVVRGAPKHVLLRVSCQKPYVIIFPPAAALDWKYQQSHVQTLSRNNQSVSFLCNCWEACAHHGVWSRQAKETPPSGSCAHNTKRLMRRQPARAPPGAAAVGEGDAALGRLRLREPHAKHARQRGRHWQLGQVERRLRGRGRRRRRRLTRAPARPRGRFRDCASLMSASAVVQTGWRRCGGKPTHDIT